MSNQTISNKAIFIIAITAVSAVFVSSFFTYLTESARLKIEAKRIAVEDKLAEIERERIKIEDKLADNERENIRLNNKITIDKMTYCMKTMMEESRHSKNIPIQPKEARELCKDLQNIK